MLTAAGALHELPSHTSYVSEGMQQTASEGLHVWRPNVSRESATAEVETSKKELASLQGFKDLASLECLQDQEYPLCIQCVFLTGCRH